MTRTVSIVGVALATAAAALFVTSPSPGSAAESSPNVVKHKCFGGNACRGQSECKTTSNACKGQNACQGKGFTLYNPCDRHGQW